MTGITEHITDRMENIYRAQITVNGDLWGVPHSGMNFWNYAEGGKKIALPYTFDCIVMAESEEDARKKCMANITLKRVYKTHYFDYSVTGIFEVEEQKGEPLENRIEMLRKKYIVLKDYDGNKN